MKKILLSLALTAGLTGTASAADLAVKARPMMAAPVVGYSWTGCYIGAGGGYGVFNQRHRSIDAFGVPYTALESDTGGKGFFGTAQVGCDYQFADRWVIGAFGDYDFGRIRGNLEPTGFGIVGEEKLRNSWSAGGRLGYAVFPRFLAYVSGGYTEARFDGVNFASIVTGLPTTTTLDAQRYRGFFIGSGYEYGIDFLPGLFWKTEYRYAQYRAESPVLSTPTLILGVERSEKDIQTVRTELVYRFNWGGGPVVARY